MAILSIFNLANRVYHARDALGEFGSDEPTESSS